MFILQTRNYGLTPAISMKDHPLAGIVPEAGKEMMPVPLSKYHAGIRLVKQKNILKILGQADWTDLNR